MKKIVLIDGNNFMFRSFYATASSTSIMQNSKGFPTNALFGFITMINKIVAEEKPNYMAVAFDIGKNFRKAKYDFYKEGRVKTPEELKMQMPIARDILKAMGIKSLELEPYEADDIIGTIVKMCEEDKDFDATIISSDKDLLQLINFETDMKLLKKTGYIRYNERTFEEDYGIKPINIIDLKALMGDSSDNIPGVKGIGEKTALKLLNEYKTIENLYDHLDNITGSVHDKLESDKSSAFMSKEIATIYKDVPLDIDLNDLKYDGGNDDELRKIYNELEFFSLIKNLKPKQEENIKYINVTDDINVVLDNKVSLYIEYLNSDYTNSLYHGAAVYDGNYLYYFNKSNTNKLPEILKNKEIITYDHKKNIYNLDLPKAVDDIMISSYLLGICIKDDISDLMSTFNEDSITSNSLAKEKDENVIIQNIVKKCKFIFEKNDELKTSLEEQNLTKLYEEIEMPLIYVLSSMEKEGVVCKKEELDKHNEIIDEKLREITTKIYEYAGEEFNIGSPKQLGDILFEKMQIAKGSKNKTGYKTDESTLEKLIDVHPIIELILNYRGLAKLKSTYLEGLENYIDDSSKIHTIFKQTIARTGRLSSTEPNLQNIPVRDEEGKNIRKAFVPNNDLFLSCDYSQIELRVLAHIAGSKPMIDTFKSSGDIHARVAADINGVDLSDVTKDMRSKAKAVIFGIVYGISSFGLKDNLNITKTEAQNFINKYYDMYPEVKVYMSKMKEFAKANGYVTTLFNRKRVIDEIKSSNFMIRQSGERIAINTPIQGTAADIIKLAMIKIYDKFNEENIQSKMILQVHDELIFDVKKEELEKVESIVKDVMENVIDLEVPLLVSTDTGDNWYETK